MRSFLPSSHEIAARTPAERDRYVDLLRFGSIVFVVLGHWLVGVVEIRDEAIEVRRLIAVIPETQPLTWIFQVMPLFFLVGGAVNAGSWIRAQARGEAWPVWLRRRARRLLGPLVPLLALWIPATAILSAAPVPEGWVAAAVNNALLPLWFLVVYLLAIALVPVTMRLHDRFGLGVVIGAVVVTGIVDALHRGGLPLVGMVSFVTVWVGMHQVGYFWHSGRLPGGRGGVMLAGAGAIAMALLLTVGGYPVAMVAPGEGIPDNTSPPSLALWALLVVQLGIVLAARRPMERWLDRPRVWAPVALGGSMIMTVFLWHMTALVLVGAAMKPTGIWPQTATIDGTWWALRPLWVLLCALALALLVAVFRRFEELDDPVPREGRLRALLGLGATVVGLGLILTDGVYEPGRITPLPLGPLGLLVVGLGALGVLRSGSPGRIRR